jgi:hypothetical protein|tara:strand:- start:2520 stop:2774 length:255 start_codon:yes stop_codon:yes gene_type:complete
MGEKREWWSECTYVMPPMQQMQQQIIGVAMMQQRHARAPSCCARVISVVPSTFEQLNALGNGAPQSKRPKLSPVGLPHSFESVV